MPLIVPGISWPSVSNSANPVNQISSETNNSTADSSSSALNSQQNLPEYTIEAVKNQKWTLETLPDDVLFAISKELDVKSLINLGKCSWKMHEIVENPHVWIQLILKRFGRLWLLNLCEGVEEGAQGDAEAQSEASLNRQESNGSVESVTESQAEGWETDSNQDPWEDFVKLDSVEKIDQDKFHKSLFRHYSRLFVPGEAFFITHLEKRPLTRGYWYMIHGESSKSMEYAKEWTSLKKTAGISLKMSSTTDATDRIPLRGLVPLLDNVCWLEAKGYHLSVPPGKYRVVWSLGFAPHTGSLQGTRFEARILLPTEISNQRLENFDDPKSWSVFGKGREGLKSELWLRWPNRMETRTLWPHDAPQPTPRDEETLEKRREAKRIGLLSSMVLESHDYSANKTPRGSWPELDLREGRRSMPKTDKVHWVSLEQPQPLIVPSRFEKDGRDVELISCGVEFEIMNLSGLWKHGLLIDGVSLVPWREEGGDIIAVGEDRQERQDARPRMIQGGFFEGMATLFRHLFNE